MKHGPLIFGLIAFALTGCEKAGEPSNTQVNTMARQAEPKGQASGSPGVLLWSTEFRDQTLKECIQSATADGSVAGVRKCKCVVEKASTTIPEQQFKAINTDPSVKELVKKIASIYIESIRLFKSQPQATLKEIGRWLPALEKKPQVLEKCYELFAAGFEPTLTPSLTSINSILKEVALQDPRARHIAAVSIVEKII